MKTHKYIAFILGISMFFISAELNSIVYADIQFATITATSRATLKGLRGVRVFVNKLNPEIEKDGLTLEQLRADTEQNLRTTGIKVLSEQEWAKEKGRPYLHVQASIGKDNLGIYYFNIRVELKQKSTLARFPDIEVFAPTWERMTTGRSGDLKHVQDSARGLVNRFINAYRAVNP